MPIKNLPKLDPPPSGIPHDWQFSKIQMMKGVTIPAYPDTWKNPLVSQTAPRDQGEGGTCVGQSTAYYYDLIYMMILNDLPTDADKAQFKKDVIDALGTKHDILYPKSSSAECFYQISRNIGNITYPEGSETRLSLRAWIKYGMNLESQWHTDKLRTCVWQYPPGPRVTADGGISPEDSAVFGALHLASGYAMCGAPDGGASWEEICSAIYAKGAVLGAIPVYENYGTMQGGDGTFPDPSGNIAGYHALCFYGYDEDYLYLVHSWGDWCGRFGRISKNYYNYAQNQCVWMVVLDTQEVLIGRQINRTIPITSNVTAMISVNGVNAGNSPQKISVEPGKTYTVMASADGYISQSKTVDDSVSALSFTLETVPQPIKSWYQPIIDLIKYLIALFKR